MPSVFRISDPEETDTALRLYGMDWAAVDRILGLRGLKRMLDPNGILNPGKVL